MPRISELLPGDLISDIDDEDHFMMWVGGAEAIIENVDTGEYGGIFRHSDSKIRKRLAARDEGSEGSDSDEDLEGFDVFRCQKPAVAKRAAEFAIAWSTSKSDEIFKEGKASDEHFNLKVPFNQARLGHERQQDPDDWDARSLFRAVRVLARHESSAPVSVKGWTCSCFVTYCFQAAALSLLFKENAIPSNMLETIRRSGSQDFLSIKNDLNLIELALAEQTEVVRKLIPAGLLVDGKAIDATFLREFLNKPDNGFDKLGNITP